MTLPHSGTRRLGFKWQSSQPMESGKKGQAGCRRRGLSTLAGLESGIEETKPRRLRAACSAKGMKKPSLEDYARRDAQKAARGECNNTDSRRWKIRSNEATTLPISVRNPDLNEVPPRQASRSKSSIWVCGILKVGRKNYLHLIATYLPHWL
jgi:hypothetical protein